MRAINPQQRAAATPSDATRNRAATRGFGALDFGALLRGGTLFFAAALLFGSALFSPLTAPSASAQEISASEEPAPETGYPIGSYSEGIYSDTISASSDTPQDDEPRVEKIASRPFDFSLTGTGDGLEGTRAGQTISGINADAYDYNQSGQNQFIVPKAALSDDSIVVSGDAGWKSASNGDGEEVYILAGHCRVQQGESSAEGPRGVVRVIPDPNGDSKSVILYLEKENQWEPFDLKLSTSYLAAHATETAWQGTFRTSGSVDVQIADRGSDQLNPEEIYARALAMEKSAPADAGIPDTQGAAILSTDQPDGGWEETHNAELTSSVDRLKSFRDIKPEDMAFRRIRLMSRYDRDLNLQRETDPTNPSRDRYVISGGFILMIEGITAKSEPVSDVIDISADRAVIWADGIDLQQGGLQNKDLDLELYVEGDIIFREGERVIYAQKMYYDAKNLVGLIKDTEMVIPVPDSPGGYFRINAETISQNDADTLTATDAWVSTSTMGQPTYRLQSNSLTAEFRKTPLYDSATGAPAINAETGKQEYRNDSYVIAENNFVALENVPVFYWPWMSMNMKNKSLYLRRLEVAHDSTFGTQVRTGWNPYQIFNIKKCSENTDWVIDLDYLSKRGFGHGTTYSYNVDSLFGCQTQAIGVANYYGVYDRGTDNLGLGRRNDPFPHKYRYRGIWKHKQRFDLPDCLEQYLPDSCCCKDSSCCSGWELTAQVGKSSDRNYLREYFEEEWFTDSNPETSLELKKTTDNWSMGVTASVMTDKFYTGTNELPKFSHFLLGQNLCCNKLLWYEHTKLGLYQFKTTESPFSQQDQDYFRYLNWELASSATDNTALGTGSDRLSATSFNLATRHELDLPLAVGPGKITPYALGEYAFWGKGYYKNNINRLYGRTGLRADLPVWKVDNDITSDMWYLNGIAHKMNFGVDAFIAGANRGLDELIHFDQIDDWQVQDFRRQYSVTSFTNSYSPYQDSIPVRFDERYYALREGVLGGMVSSPSSEIAGDMTQIRLDWLNRWQTKRGPVGNRHIIDWITLDTGMSLYPKKEQDYGEFIGLADYDLRWHVGDRFSVLSSGLFDFFDSGQKIIRAGVMSKRPGVSSFYLGVDRLGGPISTTYLNAAVNYRMSQKWAASLSNSYDLADHRNIGQELGISRIGESFIWTLKLSNNQSKKDWGIGLNVLPIFIYNNEKFEEDVLGFGQM
ncbi:MAG: hypothetical protein J6S40_09515 [Thermoguttaceae bacterium]|nr:hypothetical protein [Thermoguttaceae bacterium]